MFDIVSKRNWFFAASLALIIPGLIAILTGGIKPGIDFTGGTLWNVKVTNTATTAAVYNVLSQQGHPEAVVQNSTTKDSTGATINSVQMRFKEVKQDEKFKISQALMNANLINGHLRTKVTAQTATGNSAVGASGTPTTTAVIAPTGTVTSTKGVTTTGTLTTGKSLTTTNPITGTGTTTSTGGTNTATPNADPATLNDAELSYQTVGPAIGSEISANAVLAVVVASLAILAYLWYAFRKVPSYGQGGIPQALRFGICAVVAMLHDVLVVLGVFAILGHLFGIEIDALFITAMLTVVGFSVHDTIVVFDRVRENLARRIFPSYAQVVNHSLLQTLARSINTSLTVIITLTALLLFGGSSIRDFVLALLIGIISGTYSSIFNASLLLVVWENGWRAGPTVPPTTALGKARTA